MSIHAHRFFPAARPQPADLTAAMTRALIALLDGPLSRGRRGFAPHPDPLASTSAVADVELTKTRGEREQNAPSAKTPSPRLRGEGGERSEPGEGPFAATYIADLTAMCLVRRGLAVVSPGGTSLKLTELGRYLAADKLARRAEPLAREAAP